MRLNLSRRVGIATALLLIVGAFAYLTLGVSNNLVYFLTPAELLAKGAKGYGTPVRLGGVVVPNSVQWNADALDLRFRMTDGKESVLVHSRGAPPQMFRGSIGVIVEGTFDRSGVFESHSLMVKHSNEYRPPATGAKPAEIFKALPPGSGS
jgi:cytochrome c-type biogenesis protein CcmE